MPISSDPLILRVAIISSPRSGNTWVRSVLAQTLKTQELAFHNYLEAPAELPKRCFLQIHWYREPNFQKWLLDNQFKVICVSRHPLDILISVLHFIRFEPETHKWLGGNVQIPSNLRGASPSSEAFIEYALSFGAENLLSISYQWWRDETTYKLRYEDLVKRPEDGFGAVLKDFQGDSESLCQWLDHFSLEKMKALPNRHGWQGHPGLYTKLIPHSVAMTIYRRYATLFETLGYQIDPYFLSKARAEKNWQDLL